MGKQKPKQIDLSAFDTAVSSKEIDLSAFDNEVKKNGSPQSLPTTGINSSTGSDNDPTYETGQLEEVNITARRNPLDPNRPQDQPFNMADNQPKTRSGFYEWKASLPKRLRYEGDYDLKGYYNKYGASKVKGEAHLTDEFKLPNHPTFSTESKYFNENTKMQGGEWDGDSYVPFDPSKPIFDEKNNKYLPNTRRAPQGQDYAQNENPLGMMVPEQTPFNFAQSSNPELTQAYEDNKANRLESLSNQLKNHQAVYDQAQGEGRSKAIQKAVPKDGGEINTNIPDEQRKGNRASYLYDEILNGLGSIAAGLGDVAVQGGTALATQGAMVDSPNLTEYRQETAPSIRNFLTKNIGADLDPKLKRKYQDETFTAALGGLANSAPAIAATVGSGGVGSAAMFLQSYDNALQSIEGSEEGRNLDNTTKTIFATSVGTVVSALEKYGLDKIFKGESGAIANLITKQAVKQAARESGGKVTGDVLTKFLDNEVLNLSSKYLKGGIKALDGALVEYGTEALQEGAQAGGELLLNAETGKSVFDTSETGNWKGFLGRMNKAGVLGAIGGGMLGSVAAIANINRGQIETNEQKLQEVNTALENENLSESSRQVLTQSKIQAQEAIEQDAEKVDKAFNELSPEQQEKVMDITDRKVKITESLNDEDIPESVKKDLVAEDKLLDDELKAIKPEPVTKTEPTESTPVKKGSDVAIDDTVELVNGKKGTVTKIEGDQITILKEDGTILMATPDLVEMTVVKPKEAVQETQTPVEVKEPVKEKETIVEAKIEVSPEQKLMEATNGDTVTFTYDNAEDIPDVLKDKITSESEINGKKTIRVTLPKSEAEQLLNQANETKLPIPEKENLAKETIPQEKPKEVIEPAPIEVVNETVKEPTEKPKKETTSFDDLANKRLPNKEVRDTKSNVERETGDTLTLDIKEFDSVDFKQSMLHGEDVVEAAKKEFGKNYVTGTLDYVKESKMPFENKAVILVSLENNLRKQLLADPKNKQLRKQVAAATAASVAHLRSGATAAATGIFRQAARTEYNTQLALEAIFSPKQLEARAKVEGAVSSTSEDIQESYEASQADIQDAIDKGVEERVNEIYESMPTARRQRADKAIAALDRIQKKLRGKTYDATIGVPIAIIDAGITTIKATIRAGVDIADAIELGIKKIKEQHGKAWDKENEFRQDMLNGFSEEGVKTTTVEASLKQELIDAGYGKEINVSTKNGKEKRNVLDWRKLTGIEGSFDTMKENLNRSFKGKGYSQSEIGGFEKQLQEDYNDIHAGIIEKSINELNRRNTIRGNQTKPLARRLAELYNLGLYDSDPATYENILNNALGVNQISQDAFNEIKALNKSLAQLMDTRKPDGTRLSDVALAALETDIKNRISGVIRKVQFAEGNMFFKTSDVLKNLFSAMQRMMLVKISQLVENPFSGKVNDIQVQLQDAFKKGKWDTKELAQRRAQISKLIYQDITLRGGDEYGGVGNPFTSKNDLESFVNDLSKNPLYTLATAVLSGRIYLDATDSFFKIKRTEKEFTHNLLRVLTDPSNPNGSMSQEDALQYVSEALTGQSFEESKKVARQIIEDVNKAGGKELIRSTESNVLRVANDIVKDNLVNGGAMDAKTMEAAFKAGYHTAGKSIGHESNNIITDGVGKINELIQVRLQEALKRKDYSTAAILNLTSILSKNIINPFVGGGTNWTILGLQKIGLPTEFLRSDVGLSKKPIDLSTKEGLKDLQKNLAANAERSRMYGRMVIGTFTGLAALLALKAVDDEDDYLKWLKKHPETRKLINKLQPVPVTLALASEEGADDFIKAVFEVFGSRQNFDALKVKNAAQGFYEGYANDNESEKKKAWGTMGELIGRRTNVPYISAFSNFGQAEKKLRDDFTGNPNKTDFKASKGFINGYYKGGFVDYLMSATGFKEEGAPFIGDANLSPADIKKSIRKAQEDLKKKRNKK